MGRIALIEPEQAPPEVKEEKQLAADSHGSQGIDFLDI
jgi:hypothetical protein